VGRRVQNRGKKKFVFDFFLNSDIQIAKKNPSPYVRVCPDFPNPPPPLGLEILCEWPLNAWILTRKKIFRYESYEKTKYVNLSHTRYCNIICLNFKEKFIFIPLVF
jgi:hypothetical protein